MNAAQRAGILNPTMPTTKPRKSAGRSAAPAGSSAIAPGKPRSIGAAIRHARRGREMTLEQLAVKTRLSVSYLSQLERDRMTSSLAALKRIAEALKVPAGSLMFAKAEAASRSLVDVVPAKGRKRLVFPGSNIRYEMLTPDLRRRASLLWLEAPAGADSGAGAFSHEGEDAVVVLQGRIDVEVGGIWHSIGRGDSIYFSSELPHRWRNPGKTRAVAIWMSTPPSF